MSFSASEIAFEGFRLTREKPVAIAWWALAQLIASLAAGVAAVYFVGPELETLQSLNREQPGDLASINALWPALAKLYGLAIPLALVTGAVFTCAVFRSIARPQDKAFGYLRFGADELRMILLNLVLALIYAGAVGTAVVGVVAVSAGIGMVAGGEGAAAGLLVGLLAFLGIVGATVFMAVRLSLAAPMTFARGRLEIGEAWKLTRGQFWPLLGAYFISWVLAVVVAMLGMAVVFGVIAAVGGMGAMGEVMNPDFSSIAGRFTPVTLAVSVCSAALNALQFAILTAPPAVAYRDLSGDTTVDTFA